MVYILKMMIFYSYVKLPEGIYIHILQLLTYIYIYIVGWKTTVRQKITTILGDSQSQNE